MSPSSAIRANCNNIRDARDTACMIVYAVAIRLIDVARLYCTDELARSCWDNTLYQQFVHSTRASWVAGISFNSPSDDMDRASTRHGSRVERVSSHNSQQESIHHMMPYFCLLLFILETSNRISPPETHCLTKQHFSLSIGLCSDRFWLLPLNAEQEFMKQQLVYLSRTSLLCFG
ncbi:hypothetical protein BJX61DRAFT_92720 [Aspergillus egyptiacus]|nr:hypothetical protein BJX61DRAFT_92720 [Aspergillus egyptiacus]